ncbi:cache domain-containing sensor histidine kinase [Enterococcus sp. LJL98]
MRMKFRQLMHAVTQFFYRKGLQFTLLSTFTLVSVVAVLFVTAGYMRQFSTTTEQMMRDNSLKMLDQVNLNLDDYLHRLMGVSNTAYYKILKDSDMSQNQDSRNRELGLLFSANESILSTIAVFDDQGNLLHSAPSNQLKKDSDPTQENWFIQANEKIENVHFSQPAVETLFQPMNNTYHWVVSLSRSVELMNHGAVERGVLLVNMNFTGIEKISLNANFGHEGYVYLMTPDGQIIYHPKQQLIYSGLMLENTHAASNYSEGSHQEVFQGEKRIVTVKTMGYTGWKVVGVTPVSEMRSAIFNNHLLLVSLAVMVSLLILSINLLISARVTNPLRQLEKAVSRMEQDIYDIDIPVEGSYEIQHLSRTLMTMAHTMQRLMADIVKQQEQMREKEMNVLQQQINPHFLYNTLDSTIWMIESGRYEGAITMITSLAKFFRISLSKGKNIIALEDEIKHVQSYLTIQEIRYKNKFSYTIAVDESIENAATIKLIIQPLVENAIYHGMDYMYEEGEIQIRAYRYQEAIYIDIEDNGPGMTEEEVNHLRHGTKPKTKKRGSGIGFANVEERIKLFYGDQYGIAVYSEPDEGTLIRIHLPFQPIEEESEK